MAERNEMRADLLLGTRVRSVEGTAIGRIEEMRAEREHGYWVVTEFHLGPTAMIERLAVRHLGWTLPGRVHGYRVRWDQLDLTDPEHPRLTCGTDDLEHLGAPRRSKRHAA